MRDATANEIRTLAPAHAVTALAVFDDAILRLAVERALTVIELRLVCTQPDDYANPIEPSVQGGAKIARAVARALVSSEAHAHAARVLAG
jgi:hypothetical protein